MNAEIVSIGTELLLGQIVDSHAATASRLLAECGIPCLRRHTVGDNLSRIVETLQGALQRCDLVLTIGGLGPTEDDLTRDAIAQALGESLIEDREYAEHLQLRFRDRPDAWAKSHLRQAMRPPSCEPIANPNGTAPGLICRQNGKVIIALPGPRAEFEPMLNGPVLTELRRLGGGAVIASKVLRVCGIGESLVEERVRDLLSSPNPTIAPLAHPGEVHLRLTAAAASREAAEALIAPLAAEVRRRLGDAVYGEDATTLEEAVVSLLRERGETVTVAESCTGGGLGARITAVSGASDVFVGGVISYSNEWKARLLGVPPEVLSRHGAVSHECAEAMALGARALGEADWSVSITGVAGPTGGTPEKPVGLVYIGLAGPGFLHVAEHRFAGDREAVRFRSTQAALTLLRRSLLDTARTSSQSVAG